MRRASIFNCQLCIVSVLLLLLTKLTSPTPCQTLKQRSTGLTIETLKKTGVEVFFYFYCQYSIKYQKSYVFLFLEVHQLTDMLFFVVSFLLNNKNVQFFYCQLSRNRKVPVFLFLVVCSKSLKCSVNYINYNKLPVLFL